MLTYVALVHTHMPLTHCIKDICKEYMHLVLARIRPGSDGRNHYWQLFGLFQRPQGKADKGKFLFWDIKVATAKRGGKPPPESAARILASEALNCVKQSPTNPALLITDGAPCYKSLSAKFGWRHEACNHSKGIFCTKKRIKNKRILIHTGGVDSMWRLSKSAIPCSLATRVNGNVNPKLMRSIRIWQWRWQNSKENVLEKTGRMLQKRMDG